MKEDLTTGQSGALKRDSKDTRFKKGTKGNPGGFTKDEREAREEINALLRGELRQVGLDAYRRCLEAGAGPG